MAEPIKFFARHNTVAIPAIPAIREGKRGGNWHGIAGIAGIAGGISRSINCEKLENSNQSATIPTMEQWQISAITAWVGSLGCSPESIAEVVGETLAQCEADAEARLYFLKRATECVPTKPTKPIMAMCGNCTHFKSHHAHSKGSGSCTRHVMPSGVCHWSETQHTCNTFTPKEQPPC